MVDNPSAPVLATVPGVEIASVGFWNISNAEDWHPSAEDLASAVAALDCPAVRRPTLKFGHTGQPGQGDPSIGLIDNMRLDDDGQTLVGDFVGVPSWLASADAEGRSVIASAYPDRSGEFQHDYVCQLGHTHPFVVHAVALLGVVRPGIGTLESLYDLYAKAPQKEEPTMAKAAIALAGTTIDQVRKSFYDGPGGAWCLWIREMFVDPPELIVQNDDDDTITRVPYTVSGDGEVEFGDPQSVKVQYVDARAATEKPAMAFASHAEARPGKPQTSSAAEAEGHQGKEGAMPTLKEGLAQKLGIAADADDETTLKALDEALAERAGESDDSTTGAQSDNTDSAADVQPELVDAAAPKVVDNIVQLDKAQYDTMMAAATQVRQIQAERDREGRDKLVAAAIGDGRITPASKADWLKALEVDPGGHNKTALASLKPGLVPLAEIGHGVGAEATEDDSLYASLFGKEV